LILTFFCRLAADLSLYFSFANCVLIFAAPGNGAAFWEPALILLAAGSLSYSLKRISKVFSAAPLFLPFLIPVLLPGWLPLLLSLPPWIYLAYIILFDLEQLNRSEYHHRFFLGLKIMPLLLLPLLFSLKPEVLRIFQARVLPCVLFFLFCGVLSLRLARYQPAALRRKSVQLANILLLALFTLICLVLIYSKIWLLIGESIFLLYRFVIAPILLLLALVITLPFFAISALLKLLAGEPQTQEPIFMELGEFIDTGLETYSSLQIPVFVKYIAIALLLMGVLWIVWRFFRRLASRRVLKAANGAIVEERIKLGSVSGVEIDLFPPSDPRRAVRYYYRRFLRLCRKHGLAVGQHHTSRDVGAAAADWLRNPERADENAEAQTALKELRALYLPARYAGDASIDNAGAGLAKNDYNAINKAFSHRSGA
jgi:hypothetical protein